jgi:hypothetical protein
MQHLSSPETYPYGRQHNGSRAFSRVNPAQFVMLFDPKYSCLLLCIRQYAKHAIPVVSRGAADPVFILHALHLRLLLQQGGAAQALTML